MRGHIGIIASSQCKRKGTKPWFRVRRSLSAHASVIGRSSILATGGNAEILADACIQMRAQAHIHDTLALRHLAVDPTNGVDLLIMPQMAEEWIRSCEVSLTVG
ncbi:MAG: hypothetical protein U1E76_20190 [Planctomycetota bacterium]